MVWRAKDGGTDDRSFRDLRMVLVFFPLEDSPLSPGGHLSATIDSVTPLGP